MKTLIVIITILLLSSISYSQTLPPYTQQMVVRDSIASANWTKYDSLTMVNAKTYFTLVSFLYIYRVYATNCFNDSTYQTTRTQLTYNGIKNPYKYNYDTFHRDVNDLNAFFFFLMTNKMTESKHYIQY